MKRGSFDYVILAVIIPLIMIGTMISSYVLTKSLAVYEGIFDGEIYSTYIEGFEGALRNDEGYTLLFMGLTVWPLYVMYRTRMNKAWFPVSVIILIFAVWTAQVMANIHYDLVTDPMFADELDAMPKSNQYINDFPKYLGFLGLVGLALAYGKPEITHGTAQHPILMQYMEDI